MSTKKRVVIVGYPKSGNTWLSRLIGQLLDCPVVGFFNDPENNDIAIEGGDRKSNFEVYKAHHAWDQIEELLPLIYKIIYIVRDPRDIAVSGAYFFNVDRFENLNKLESQDKFAAMAETVSYGSSYAWCHISWAQHVRGWLKRTPEVLIVRYEDLLNNGPAQLKRASLFLGLESSSQEIDHVLSLQDFNTVKQKFMDSYDKRKIKHLRSGKDKQYIHLLRASEIEKIERTSLNEMACLDYQLVSGDLIPMSTVHKTDESQFP